MTGKEQLAKELFLQGGFGHFDTWESSPKEYKQGWEFVAEYVNELLVKTNCSITAEELRNKFEKDLKDLQDNCPHPTSTIMPYSWAPGHFIGDVKICEICEKILE